MRLDAAGRRDDRPGPAHRVPVERNAAAGRIQRPPEIDRADRSRVSRGVPSSRLLSKYSPLRPERDSSGCGSRRNSAGTVTNSRISAARARRVAARVRGRRSFCADAVEDRRSSSCRARCSRRAAPRRRRRRSRRSTRSVFASGSMRALVAQQHHRRRAPLRARARDDRRGRSTRAASSTSTYGFSNSPSSNFARSTRATAASTIAGGDQAALKRVQIRALLAVRRLKDHVEPGLERVLRRDRRVRLGMCSTVAPPVADASEMTNPWNPQSRFRMPFSSRGFCVAGQPVHRVVGGHHRSRAGLPIAASNGGK